MGFSKNFVIMVEQKRNNKAARLEFYAKEQYLRWRDKILLYQRDFVKAKAAL